MSISERSDLREALLVHSSMNSTSSTADEGCVLNSLPELRRLDDPGFDFGFGPGGPGDNTLGDTFDAAVASVEGGVGKDQDTGIRRIPVGLLSPIVLAEQPEHSGEVEVHGINDKTSTHWLDESVTVRALEVNSAQKDLSSRSIDILEANVRQSCFTSKYQEAALFIWEGEEDSKVYHHPTNKWSKKAYEIVHRRAFYLVHLLICIGILLLAFAETPYIGESSLTARQRKAVAAGHAALELVFLTFMAINVVLYAVWLQSKFFKHRIAVIAVVVLVLYVEALTVIVRQDNHFRITRIFRPFFLLDTHYMRGVRRVARQTLEVLKPITDVLILLVFFIFFFALFGYLIFSENDPNYFGSFGESFLSLFIATTTANHPDVMMGSYAQHSATPIFFVLYLILTLYFASNVLLAVVYSSFSEVDKRKYKKLFCHRRDALLRAFWILTDEFGPNRRLQFHDFLLVMHHFRPSIPEWQVLCIFKSLNKNPHSDYTGLEEEDFLRFYEVLDFNWTQVDSYGNKLKWFSHFPSTIVKPMNILHHMVSHRIYKFLLGLVVLINLIFLVVYASRIQDPAERFDKFQKALPGTFIFLSIYILDVAINIISYGPFDHFRKFWNVFDALIISISFISAIVTVHHNTWAVLLPLKLIRLIRLKRSYRDLLKTVEELLPRLLSITVLILILYYSFAIVGMEFFSGRVKEGCCTTAKYGVAQYYAGSINASYSSNVYYLNNFDNILRSYATLFILMVVNNWYIIMEGFASQVEERYIWLTRVYFMMFYIIMLVVLQVVIAFVVEAFQLKITATAKRRICRKHPKDDHCGCQQETRKKVPIVLVEADLAKLQYEINWMDDEKQSRPGLLSHCMKKFRRRQFKIKGINKVNWVGSRPHTKEDVHQLHYKEEIKTWRKERPSNKIIRRPSQNVETKSQTIKELIVKWGKKILNFIID